jgi:Protein of unknown function (DUF2974)
MKHGRGSFNEQVKNTDGVAKIDLDLAEIANAIYLDNHSRVNERWRLMDDNELPKNIDPNSLVDDKSLFRAGIYTNDEDQYVVAYRGSYTKKFGVPSYVSVNVGQAMGLDTRQYEQASALAQQAQMAYGDKVVFTGHSLGGGLAAAASIRTGNAAVTFNPSGLSEATYYANSMTPDIGKQRARDGMIRKYQLNGEFLQGIEHTRLAPIAPGRETILEHPIATGAKELHKMDRVVSAMELDPGMRFVDSKKYEEILQIWKKPQSTRSESEKNIAGLINDAVEKGLAKHGTEACSKYHICRHIRDKAITALTRGEAIRPHGVGHRSHVRAMQGSAGTETEQTTRAEKRVAQADERPPPTSMHTTHGRTRSRSPERGDR